MEILRFAFMQRALSIGLIIGALGAVLGVFVVLKRLSFMGAGISHAAFGGIALGYFLGWDPILTAVIFCISVGIGISMLIENNRIKEDTAVGIFFTSTMALGILLIGLKKEYNIDLFGYLFGNILAVSREDLVISLVVGAIVALFLYFFFKELILSILDPEMARVIGLPVSFLNYLLVSLIALFIVISTRIVGIILVSALLTIPAATSLRWSKNLKQALIISLIDSLGCTIGGLILSYYLDTAPGATIVILATLIFFITLFFNNK